MLRRLVPKPTRDVDFGARLQAEDNDYFYKPAAALIYLTFVESQFGAVFGLAVNVLFLFTFNRMANAEATAADQPAEDPA